VQAALAAGIRSIDWGLGEAQAVHAGDDSADRARALCDAAGLSVCSACVQEHGIGFDADELTRYAEAARTLGSPLVRTFAPAWDGSDLRPAFERALEACGGLALLVETSPATAAPSPELARRLVEGLPPERAGVLYDPGNMIIEGHLEPRVAIGILGPYLRHVHVKSVVWERRDSGWEWGYASLRDGPLDWGEILAELARAGYDGPIAFDHLPGGAGATVEELVAEVAILRELLS
jgi:sugar phosphate isomerase/epimerase